MHKSLLTSCDELNAQSVDIMFMRLLSPPVKYTYDTPLEASQEFGSAIKETLTTLESVGKFLKKNLNIIIIHLQYKEIVFVTYLQQ